jgi:hypothetical protein
MQIRESNGAKLTELVAERAHGYREAITSFYDIFDLTGQPVSLRFEVPESEQANRELVRSNILEHDLSRDEVEVYQDRPNAI